MLRHFSLKLYVGVLVYFISGALYAVQFTATVSAPQIELGQSIVLNLTLKDAKAKGNPNIEVLLQNFSIEGQQQYSTFSSTNGTISTESGWDLTLTPNRTGEIIIPSIMLKTDQGVIFTAETSVHVVPASKSNSRLHGSAGANNDSDHLGVSIVATTNKTSTYVKEPIIYTLKIISYKPMLNVSLDPITSSDATIDRFGEPKQYDQVVGGVRAHIIEFKYYITPVSAGKITINPAVFHGEIQAPNKQAPVNHYGMLNNFLFNDIIQFKPFKVSGEKITITALAPAMQGKDWLPLQKLTISEEWQGDKNPKAGDTIIRKIKMVATGGFSNQLPSMQPFMEHLHLKSYADKPIFNDNINPNTDVISGIKEESFSVVATQAGKFNLPEIRIPWWNLNTKKMEIAVLPAKTLEILPGVAGASQDAVLDYSAPNLNTPQSQENSFITSIKENKSILLLLTALIAVIIALIAAVIYLIKFKINNKPRTLNKSQAQTKVGTKTNLAEDAIHNARDLRVHIMQYAQKHWNAPKSLTFNKLGTFLTDHNYVYDLEIYVLLCREINAELYASATIELPTLLEAWHQLKQSVTRNKNKTTEPDKSDFINLNPT